jgi:arginyl-tRNA synthetase
MLAIIDEIRFLVAGAITEVYNCSITPEITRATQERFGDYQCNSAFRLGKMLASPPLQVAEALQAALQQRAEAAVLAISVSVTAPGFINFKLQAAYLEQRLLQQVADAAVGIAKVASPKKVVLDFSSPNIAKEMHVGHLRSTIIGDCLAKVLTFIGHTVLRINHLGDWGTQFGMLLAYFERSSIQLDAGVTAAQLLVYYQQAKQLFDQDPSFKQLAQQKVVSLQAKAPAELKLWQQICAISEENYQQIYTILDVEITSKGESTYNDLLPEIVDRFRQQQLLTTSDGALCVFLPAFTGREGQPLPLIIQKNDQGYNYATTDLAALYYRATIEQADWIIYVVDAGQAQHLAMVFAAASQAQLFDATKVMVTHVAFGLVLGNDGKKFRTRAGKTEKLIDLINAAIQKAGEVLAAKRGQTLAEVAAEEAEILGINALKYADLANHRLSDYTFSYEKMLQFEGNTAAFILYAYVRIQSILKKVGATNGMVAKFALQEPAELALAMCTCRFAEVVQLVATELMPHRLTEYLFELSEKFHYFFQHCRIDGHAQQSERVSLCQAVAQVLHCGCTLLGLRMLDSM